MHCYKYKGLIKLNLRGAFSAGSADFHFLSRLCTCFMEALHYSQSLTVHQNSGSNALNVLRPKFRFGLGELWFLLSPSFGLRTTCHYMLKTSVFSAATSNSWQNPVPFGSIWCFIWCLWMRPGVALAQVLVKVNAISLSWSRKFTLW